jgi:hypothetical protein
MPIGGERAAVQNPCLRSSGQLHHLAVSAPPGTQHAGHGPPGVE